MKTITLDKSKTQYETLVHFAIVNELSVPALSNLMGIKYSTLRGLKSHRIQPETYNKIASFLGVDPVEFYKLPITRDELYELQADTLDELEKLATNMLMIVQTLRDQLDTSIELSTNVVSKLETGYPEGYDSNVEYYYIGEGRHDKLDEHVAKDYYTLSDDELLELDIKREYKTN